LSAASDISVVIPYYNREQYVDQAIQSVLAQTLKPLEVIVVNDCSRESARRYLDRYADVCTIVDMPKNVGPSEARNAGVRRVRGQFVAFLDDDDLWLPQKLELQRDYLDKHPECAAVHSAAWIFFSGRPDMLFGCHWSGPIRLAQALTNDHLVMIPTTLIRMDVVRAIGGFDPRFRECDDRDFIIRCCAAGYKIEGIAEPLVRIRREGHPSLTQRNWRVYWMDIKMCGKHRSFYYRAYGFRGFVSFLLEKLHVASYYTPYVDGGVRFLIRLFKVKYKVRPGYRDPVSPESPIHVVPCCCESLTMSRQR
jgi:glycosyltransferase involved in cell wall biosynthesis